MVKIRSFFIYILLFAGISGLHAQGKGSSKSKAPKLADTASYPYWIRMMDDTGVVFAKAERAFYIYWKNRPTPQNDNEENEKGFEGEGRENIKYSFEYKRFKSWEQSAKNLVGPDGKILSPARQIEIWEQNHKAKNEK